MKLAKFLKTIVISASLAVSFVVAGLTMTGCGDGKDSAAQKQKKTEEINQAVSAAVGFLTTAKNGWNYTSFSEFPDGSVFKFYTDDYKIKVEYNGTYYVSNEDRLYKIIQADDMTWHKTNDSPDFSDPAVRINNLINTINNTSRASLWTDYYSNTKTLTAHYSDGSATVKLDADEFIITLITDKGTTKHTIKDVNTTSVTLPENIIDDRLN